MTAPIFATKHPTLYREFSSENFDYYGITDKTSCPLCKLDHGDEESIEDRYKTGSYFIKCEQREIHSLVTLARGASHNPIFAHTSLCDIFLQD